MAKETKSNKIGDLRGKSKDELNNRLNELRKEQFNFRIQKATGQLANVAQVRKVRKEIAQVNTLINEQAKGIKPKAKKTAKKAA